MVIRPAKVEDAYDIARVHVDSWRETYRSIVPDSVLEKLSTDQRAEVRAKVLREKKPGTLCLVAEDEGGIFGFAVGGPNRETGTEYDSELYQ